MNFTLPAIILSIGAALVFAGCEAPPQMGGTGEDLNQTTTATAGVVEEAEVESLQWMTDYDTALALAAEQNKPVLINFTGSDWCPPCIQLKKDVFSDDVFQNYANENLVLVELDYPRNIEQPPELVEQNRKLQQQFAIQGYPTLVVLNPDGEEERRQVGYVPLVEFMRWVKG